jgi:hypothetical protein
MWPRSEQHDRRTYRMTLAPVSALRVDCLARDANGGHYGSVQTTYFVSARNGEYWLITAEPAKHPSSGATQRNESTSQAVC